MRRIYKFLWCLVMPLLCLACSNEDVVESVLLSGLTEGRASVTLSISTPESFSTRTRAITEDNENVLEDKFAVFAFNADSNGEVGDLLFAVKSGDVNEHSNIDSDNTYSSAYGDYTGSPSIAWHAADASSSSGRLYIEYDETSSPLHLLVLANIDLDVVSTLLGENSIADATITPGMSFGDVVDALEPALDYEVNNEDLTSIPMAGECDLADGITLGSTGSVSLRRSVAKFTIRVEYTAERAEDYGGIENVPFYPQSIRVLNVAPYATVYSPYSADDALPHISSLNEESETIDLNYSFSGGWTYDVAEDMYYQELVFYAAETENSREPAYTDNYDGTYTENTDNPRFSILVSGQYYDYDGDVLEENWYRLDLIPEDAESGEDELEHILRNHHYKFYISDATKRGSSSAEEALELSVSDNEPHSGTAGYYVVIDDEDIISITVEVNDSGSEYMPYYIGVNSSNIELNIAYGNSACARVKVVTNYEGWSLDEYSIPSFTDSNGEQVYAISFVWDSDAQTLWLWLDYPEYVTVGETYAYYIVAGNIRKKMRITIIDSSATEP